MRGLGETHQLRHPLDTSLHDPQPGDTSFTLFEGKEEKVWLIFTVVFMALLICDSALMFARPHKLGFASALMYTLFWACTAVVFCFWVGWMQTPHSSYMWFSGYTLQWMMSFDNLFVFHLVFKIYHTPDELKHKPLFLGILGQAVFTFSLLTFGEYIFHKVYFLHLVFGAFFIYIGVSAMGDDDDDDPTQNPVIQWLQANLPFVAAYDTQGSFFIRLPLDEQGNTYIPKEALCDVFGDPRVEKGSSLPGSSGDAVEYRQASLVDVSKIDLTGHKTSVKATMLMLVVCTLEISDVIFSIDTIVAVSVQVNDLFLAFTCVAFALLTLRATFFVMEVIVQMFSLMNYGIGAILVYIGMKLLIDRWYLVPHLVDLVVLLGTFLGCILASAIYDGHIGRPSEQLLDSAHS